MIKKTLSIFCPILWAGLILGISFIEAPLKFQAPGITIPLGLGIGRLVFQALNKVEIVLLLLTIFSVWNTKSFKWTIPVIILLAIDTFLLLPILDKRAILLLAGKPSEASYHHITYIVLEALKLISLLILGFINIKSLKHETGYKK